MKKELDYFTVDGHPGWNQDKFPDWSLHYGGCGVVTACGLCIQLKALLHLPELAPCDPAAVTRKDYLHFAREMKPFLHPRPHGIDSLDLYLQGLRGWFQNVGVTTLRSEGLPGTVPVEEAAALIRSQIDRGIPLPCLVLYHRHPAMHDFQWHWFNLTGYEETESSFHVSTITYGQRFQLDLPVLWDTGYEKRGGLIAVCPDGLCPDRP